MSRGCSSGATLRYTSRSRRGSRRPSGDGDLWVGGGGVVSFVWRAFLFFSFSIVRLQGCRVSTVVDRDGVADKMADIDNVRLVFAAVLLFLCCAAASSQKGLRGDSLAMRWGTPSGCPGSGSSPRLALKHNLPLPEDVICCRNDATVGSVCNERRTLLNVDRPHGGMEARHACRHEAFVDASAQVL